MEFQALLTTSAIITTSPYLGRGNTFSYLGLMQAHDRERWWRFRAL